MAPTPGGSDGKASAYSSGDWGSIPGLGRSSGKGDGNPLQYSCLENPMDCSPPGSSVCGISYLAYPHSTSTLYVSTLFVAFVTFITINNYFVFTTFFLSLPLDNKVIKSRDHVCSIITTTNIYTEITMGHYCSKRITYMNSFNPVGNVQLLSPLDK